MFGLKNEAILQNVREEKFHFVFRNKQLEDQKSLKTLKSAVFVKIRAFSPKKSHFKAKVECFEREKTRKRLTKKFRPQSVYYTWQAGK